MWAMACVRCGVLAYEETRADAQGRAEAHALGRGCCGHTFFWRWGEGGAFLDVRRAGEPGTVGTGLSGREYAGSAERKS